MCLMVVSYKLKMVNTNVLIKYYKIYRINFENLGLNEIIDTLIMEYCFYD